MKNWIALTEKLGTFADMELWQATCHYNGHQTEGYALADNECCDFYESDPRDLPECELTNGYRLPAYMPGYTPEEE